MLALHQKLRGDISGWLDFTRLFILLVELLHPFLRAHHLRHAAKQEGSEGSRERTVDEQKDKRPSFACGLCDRCFTQNKHESVFLPPPAHIYAAQPDVEISVVVR